MAKLQILTGLVALGGDKGNVIYRGEDSPMTYPEMLVLRNVHGGGTSGEDQVFDLAEIGTVERSPGEERLRLSQIYGGKAVHDVLPTSLPDAMFPARDDTLPTSDDVKAAKAAADKVLSERKAKSKKDAPAAPVSTPKPTPTPANTGLADPAKASGLPALDQLPTK